MSEFRWYFGVGYVGMGLLLVGLAIPLLRGRVRRNIWYGFRIPASFASEEAWERINRHGGRCLLWYALAQVLLGVAALAFWPRERVAWMVWTMAFAPQILLVPMLICAFRYPRPAEGGEETAG